MLSSRAVNNVIDKGSLRLEVCVHGIHCHIWLCVIIARLQLYIAEHMDMALYRPRV